MFRKYINATLELTATTSGVGFMMFSPILKEFHLSYTVFLFTVAVICTVIASYLNGAIYLDQEVATSTSTEAPEKIEHEDVQYSHIFTRCKIMSLFHYLSSFAVACSLLASAVIQLAYLLQIPYFLFVSRSPGALFIFFCALSFLVVGSLFNSYASPTPQRRALFAKLVVLGTLLLPSALGLLCLMDYRNILQTYNPPRKGSGHLCGGLIILPIFMVIATSFFNNATSVPRIFASISPCSRATRLKLLVCSSVLAALLGMALAVTDLIAFGRYVPSSVVMDIDGSRYNSFQAVTSEPILFGLGLLFGCVRLACILIFFGAAFFSSCDLLLESIKPDSFLFGGFGELGMKRIIILSTAALLGLLGVVSGARMFLVFFSNFATTLVSCFIVPFIPYGRREKDAVGSFLRATLILIILASIAYPLYLHFSIHLSK